ncbi:type II and III secretion system protein [Citrobacter koseri]|uniref:type II and III secretion system protein n=1 Tax=Citrobacter koseri TaxID=545 RepID=UPI000E185B2A|nr:type II and III secretion system protein [Citrobacter koseri]SUX58742.1 type IV pilus biogenesis protein [Citrobacter koseri]HBC5670704.1 type II and III secretion system protein [Citrobacter koseri]
MKLRTGMLLLAFLSQGCVSDFNKKYDIDKKVKEQTSGTTTTDSAKTKPFIKYDSAFLGKKVQYSVEQQKVMSKHVKIASYEPAPLSTIMEAVSAQTGISFRINTSAISSKKSGATDDSWDIPRSVQFDGSFEGFMSYIASLYDVSTKLDENNVLKINVFDTYVMRLDFYGENNKSETTLDLSGNQATSSGGLKGKSETKFESSFWDDVEDMAQNYVTSGNYSLFKDSSILMVNSRPSEYEALSRALDKYKADNSRQFILTYRIYILDKLKEKQLSGGLDLSFIDAHNTININSSLFENLAGGLSAGWKNSHIDINAGLDALYKLTGSESLQSGSFITRNNMAVPVNMTQSQFYVSSRTRTTDDNGEVNVDVETSEIVTGTSFIITPRVLSDGRIEVVSGFTKRYLNSINEYDDVQLPNVSTTESFNSSIIKPGDLLVVGKYEVKNTKDGLEYQVLGASDGTNEGVATVLMVVGVDYYRQPITSRDD